MNSSDAPRSPRDGGSAPEVGGYLDPRDALRVIHGQTEETHRQVAYRDPVIYAVWGGAYLVGYLPLALSLGPSRLVELPLGVALGFFLLCVSVGVAVSIREAARVSRGIRGERTAVGTMYGLAWWVSSLIVIGLGYRLGQTGLAGDDYSLIYNGAWMTMVAALFMAGGAVWRDVSQFVVGAWIAVATAIALFAGLPAYFWIMSLVVGGGLLASAALHSRVRRWAELRSPGR